MELILKHFPELTAAQQEKFAALQPLYEDWNAKINVISRKDMEHFYEKHVLHSLALARIIRFKPFTKVLDVGTGGGFPAVPLAILFPEVEFTLIDSIGKKIKVVENVIETLQLSNAKAINGRAEKIEGEKFDFIVSRAVAEVVQIHQWTRHLKSKTQFNDMANGWFLWKGGDLKAEFENFQCHCRFYNLSDYFEGEFFETKKIVYFR